MAENCCNPGIQIGDVPAQFLQLASDQRTAANSFHRYQTDLAGGKIEHLQRTRKLDQLFYVFGQYPFRTNRKIDTEIFRENMSG